MEPSLPVIYLDNAATTRPADEVTDVVRQHLGESFGNPSSRHRLGLRARNLVERARECIAETAGIAPDGVVFTSGGTEANNLAALGLPLRSGTRRVVTSNAEHDSLAAPLAARDCEITEVAVNPDGRVGLDALTAALGPDVGLVALFDGHNETGAVNPLEAVMACVTEHSPRALVHTDSVQSFGKRPLAFPLGIHSASISGHKIHGPKGVGALLLNTRTNIAPVLHGGGQESGRRSGTENVPGILGLAKAVELLTHSTTSSATLAEHRRRLRDGLVQTIDDLRVLGPDDVHLPHVLSVVIPGCLAENVLHHLEEADVYASTGAACTQARNKLSKALLALGLGPDGVRATLRFSVSRFTTSEDIDTVLRIMPGIVAKVRRLQRL